MSELHQALSCSQAISEFMTSIPTLDDDPNRPDLGRQRRTHHHLK
jgi:hypothetical protein